MELEIGIKLLNLIAFTIHYREATRNVTVKDPKLQNYYRDAYLQTLASINDANHICESKKTFSERFTWDIPQVEKLPSIEADIEKNRNMVEFYMNPTKTLRKVKKN